jgi:Sigma-70 region 3
MVVGELLVAVRDAKLVQPPPRPVKVPPRLIESINNLVRTSQRMLHEIGRAPTPEELAHRLGMPAEKVRRLLPGAVTGPMWRPRNAGVRGGATMSSNLLCSSAESGANLTSILHMEDRGRLASACPLWLHARDLSVQAHPRVR